MKRKWLMALFTVAMAGSCAAALAACSNGDGGGHTHDYDLTKWVKVNDTMCAHPCKEEGCTSVTGAESHVTETTTTATCTEGGDKTTTCTRCEYTVTEHENALNHDWGEWTVATDDKPSANGTGTATRTCKRSGCTAEAQTAELPALTSTEYTITNNTAKCLETGYGDYTIEKNGAPVTFNAETAALGHDFATTYTKTETEHYYACKHTGCEEKSQASEHIWQLSATGVSATSVKYVCHTCQQEDTKQVTFTEIQDGNNSVSVVHGEEITLAFFKITAAAEGLYYLKADDSAAYVTILQDSGVSTHGGSSEKNLYLEAGETVYLVYDTQGNVTKNYNVTYYAPGTETNPIRINNSIGGMSVDITLKAGEKRYYFLVGGNALYASFSETNASMVVTTKENNNATTTTYTGVNGENVVLDASGLGGNKGDREELDENAGIPFYFESGQNVTFTVTFEEKIDKGAYANPYELVLDTETPVSIKVVTTMVNNHPSRHGEELWYAFTPEVTGWYRFYSTDKNAAFINATYDRYGDDGNGFDYTVYIDKKKYEYTDEDDDNAVKYRPYMCQLTTAAGEDDSAVAADFTFKVEKAADPTLLTLGTPAQATADDLFFEYVTEIDADYTFTVSELSAGGYFTVEYSDQGTQKSVTVTEQSMTATIKGGVSVYIRLNEVCTLTVTKAEVDPYALSIGKSGVMTPNQEYTFTVPTSGDYEFTVTPWDSTTDKNNNWKIWVGDWDNLSQDDKASHMITTSSYTYTGLTAGTVVKISTPAADKSVVVLPSNSKILSLSSEVTVTSVAKDKMTILFLSANVGVKYGIKVVGQDVVLADENGTPLTSSVITANADGNYVYLKYIGSGETSGEIKISVGEETSLNSKKELAAGNSIYFKATQAGTYKFAGITLTGRSSNKYVIFNGTKLTITTNQLTLTTDSTLYEYTVQDVKAGDEFVIYFPSAQTDFTVTFTPTTPEA